MCLMLDSWGEDRVMHAVADPRRITAPQRFTSRGRAQHTLTTTLAAATFWCASSAVIMATKVQAPKSTGYSRKDLIQLSRPHLAGGGDAAAKSSKIEDCADAVMTALVEQQARLPEASRQLLGLSQACP